MAGEKGESPDRLGKGLSGLLGQGRASSHKPIVKALEDLGIEVRLKPVMIGEEAIDCLVIPAQELLIKEYELLTGIDSNLLLQSAVPDPIEDKE